MTHRSENVQELATEYLGGNLSEQISAQPGVELILLPYYYSAILINDKEELYKEIVDFIDATNEESIILILTSPLVAAELSSCQEINSFYKIWFSIKLENPHKSKNYIDQSHCALVAFAKYKQSLKHTRTRTKYTYCPNCNKTTKDYGGKKHLYDEFGTLMSDVWRDITVDFEIYPYDVISRIKDVFGLQNYSSVRIHDKRNHGNVFSEQINIWPINRTRFLNTSVIENAESNLFNADCLSALKDIPDNSVDFCFADPPYNIQKKYNNWNDDLTRVVAS